MSAALVKHISDIWPCGVVVWKGFDTDDAEGFIADIVRFAIRLIKRIIK